jgi:cytosine/adenosine deaminase-related metal-dependent hydrolase
MLLEADWVLPISGPPLPGGALLIVDGAIAAVGLASELRARHPEEQTRAFPGCVLMPGLVNAHTHLEYSAFLDFARPCAFGEWMLRLLLARRKLDSEDYGVSALWGAYECVRCGVTSIADTSFEGWTTARAAGKAGLRARVYLEVFGWDDAELPATMERLETRLAALLRECGPQVEAGLSPHAPYSVSERLYRELARQGRRWGLRLATHVAESAAEVEFLERGTGAIAEAYRAARIWKGRSRMPPGKSPVAYLASAGALGARTLAVHCVQVGEADIAVLAETGTPVVHCPRSNLRLRCGSAPVAELLRAEVVVGLGTDSLGSNDSLDMFAEMRSGMTVSRARAPLDPSTSSSPAGAASAGAAGAAPAPEEGTARRALSEEVVLRMATLDGARALGWQHLVGSLETGKRADIIAVRLNDTGPMRGDSPVGWDPVQALVRGATAADVTMTMVDGVVVSDRSQAQRSGWSRAGSLAELERTFAAVRAKLGLHTGALG